jgi:hypothetical protein
MMIEQNGQRLVTRRGVLVGTVAVGLTSTVTLPRPSLAMQWPDNDPVFAALDQKIT